MLLSVSVAELVRRVRARDGHGLKFAERDSAHIEQVTARLRSLQLELLPIDGERSPTTVTEAILGALISAAEVA